MKKTELYGELALLLTAAVWGFGFVAQSLGMDYIGEFTLLGLRNILAVLALEPIILMGRKRRGAPSSEEKHKLLKGGVIIGFFMFTASAAQQFAISWKDAVVGKVSFLTSMYMVLVPAFGIFFGRKSGIKTWISVLAGAAGMYLMCGASAGGLNFTGGDGLGVLGAVLYAFQIIAIDRFAPDVDPVRLSQMQFAVCGVVSMVCAFIFEEVTAASVWDARWAIIYLGLISSGVGYTLQIVGQKYVRPQISSLLMCLESVFGAFACFLILGERMTATEVTGAVIMLAAVLFSQTELTKKE